MTPEKIKKLIETANLTDKGDIADSMRNNARHILSENGIDWRKPKESIKDRIKSSVKMNIETFYNFEFSNSTDLLLLQVVYELVTKRTCNLTVTDNLKLQVSLTPGECKEVTRLYDKNSKSFCKKVFEYTRKNIDILY